MNVPAAKTYMRAIYVEKITPVYLRFVYENTLDKHLVTLMRNRWCRRRARRSKIFAPGEI